MAFSIKCTDHRHAARETHASPRVRERWTDGVLAMSSVQRKSGYHELCGGCALANRLDDVPEFKPEPKLIDQIKALRKRIKALEDA